MNKKKFEDIINTSLETGADFSEVFYEKTIKKTYTVIDSKLDYIDCRIINGVGIRLAKNNNIVYASTNNLKKNNLIDITRELRKNFDSKRCKSIISLPKLVKEKNICTNLNIITEEEKKNYLINIDKYTRSLSKNIIQVIASFIEINQYINIANSNNIYIEEYRPLIRLYINVTAKNEKTVKLYKTINLYKNYNNLKNIDIKKILDELVNSLQDKLDSIDIKGEEMPVVIGPEFGAVIFHEAAGHAMEATSVAKNISVLSNKIGKKIASSKVTIIDDGTIENQWGTTKYDDEGNKTKKNILIEKGVLKSYLIDTLNGRKMSMLSTSSGRREDYTFMPTSRMNNTYLEKGNDSIGDMFKNIKYGLYAKELSGGTVNPITGEFNFNVSLGYLIRNGKICECISDAMLIGNTLDILNKIEMVSNDLSFGTGMCGSKSGTIPVTCGQPTIKVSKMLVGGKL